MEIAGFNKDKKQVGVVMSFEEAALIWHRLNMSDNTFKANYSRSEVYKALGLSSTDLWMVLDNFLETELGIDLMEWK